MDAGFVTRVVKKACNETVFSYGLYVLNPTCSLYFIHPVSNKHQLIGNSYKPGTRSLCRVSAPGIMHMSQTKSSSLHRILHLSTPHLVPVLLLPLAALALEAHAPFHPLPALHVAQSTQRSGKGKGFL